MGDVGLCRIASVRYPFGRNLNERLQDVPYGENVTNRTTQDKEMEDGVHIGALVERVEQRSGYVTSTFADNPAYGTWAYGIHQGLEGHEYDQAHQYITDGFQIAMFF